MKPCCQATATFSAHTGQLLVALAGNPNSGKTTIFNALTGLRQKVANYPGVTVEKKTGRCRLPNGTCVSIVDLPGTYSLISRSPDEVVAMQVLRGLRPEMPAPDVVVVVVDASNLQRNLYLVSQLIELGRPLVVALNMMDIAERRGLHVDAEALSRQLDAPVVPVIGHRRSGIEQLREAISQARVAKMPNWPLPEAMKEELVVVGGGLAILDHDEPSAGRPQAGPPVNLHRLVPEDDPRRLDRYQALAERLLIGDYAEDLSEISRREPVASLLASAHTRLGMMGVDPMQADIEAHYRWIESVAGRSTATLEELAAMGAQPPRTEVVRTPPRQNFSQSLDAILIHKVWGLLIFAAIMGALFVSIFWLAQPVQDGIEWVIGWLGQGLTSRMSDGPLKALIEDGIFAGVGAVVVFVPQIALLFFFLAILEDSGYLARAAFLMDRLLAKVGLHGKSFIPLLSSFACAIPGIMATRTIENRKDRLATILVAPFMSCSARLPVYTLLIGAFFAGFGALGQAGIMLGLYALGIVVAAAVAWVFRRTLLRGGASPFILEMPSYKLPQASQVARQVTVNTWAFLAKAGTIIFCLSVILWAMTYYPRLDERARARFADEKAVASAQLEHSIAGRLGHAMEPLIRPLGYDWKMGVGLVGAFAAREVFVSTLGIIYSVGDVGEQTTDLSAAMRADRRPDGRPVWTPLIGLSLLVWFVLAMQCTSTLAVVKRETNGWRWPLFLLVYMNGLAWLVCLGIYQIGRLI